MSRYHLHARLFEGTLAEPIRNELQSAESDEHAVAVGVAEQLAARGFRVWLYFHEHGEGPNGHRAPYRVIGEWEPEP